MKIKMLAVAAALCAAGSVVHGATADAERPPLYYRNPMGLADTSPTPKKDSMGMDYIPVYADEAEARSNGKSDASIRISLDRVQRSGVRTEAVETRRLVRPVRAPGVVKFDERRLRSVSLRADAFVEKLYVNETGKDVVEGQPLFRIYSSQIVSAQVDYRSSAAALSMTRDETRRTRLGAEQRLRNLDVPETLIASLRVQRRSRHEHRLAFPRHGGGHRKEGDRGPADQRPATK